MAYAIYPADKPMPFVSFTRDGRLTGRVFLPFRLAISHDGSPGLPAMNVDIDRNCATRPATEIFAHDATPKMPRVPPAASGFSSD